VKSKCSFYLKTDVSRARFRADSTIHDDKLVPCAETGYHGRTWRWSTPVSSGEMSTSPGIRKKGKREDEKVKSMEESSIKSAATHEPASQASTRPTPNHLPKTT
jgi:hypothetical protein